MQNGWLWTLPDFCSYSLAFSLLTDISGVISFSELCLCHIYSVKCFWCKTSHLFLYYIHFMSLTFPSSDSPKQKKLLNRMLILWNVDWADTFYFNFCCFQNNTLSVRFLWEITCIHTPWNKAMYRRRKTAASSSFPTLSFLFREFDSSHIFPD